MEYLTAPASSAKPRLSIDAAIIQAPCSDREAFLDILGNDQYTALNARAQEMVNAGNEEEVMSFKGYDEIFPGVPVCARRWLSLTSPDGTGSDDYFSQDLSEEQLARSFGSLPAKTPLCVLFSGQDEFAKQVDKPALLTRWIAATRKGQGRIDEEFSGIVQDASHALKEVEQSVVDELVERVVAFVKSIS